MKSAFILLFLIRFAVEQILSWLNLRHLKRYGALVPAGFEGVIDAEALARTVSYTREQSRIGLIQSIYDSILLLAFLFTPLFPLYDAWIDTFTDSFILRGVIFMLILTLVQGVLDIPFSLYQTFRVERRYGFNTMTIGLWLSDLVKSTLISAVLLCAVGSGALWLVRTSPQHWWLWVWLFFFLVSITLLYVSPYLIEPLFSKFEPVQDPELEGEIRTMMEKAGLKIKSVQQMDASRRTLHSNAYFTGIGRVKRIVLFDTLLKQMDPREILAILAHEVGHWKKGHIRNRIILTEAGALVVCFLAHRLLAWGGIPALFELPTVSFPAQLLLLSFIGSLVSFPLTPLSSWLSRRHEWQADRFATDLSGMPDALATALKKLTRENLSNLHPHPVYALFYYSHPPVVQRVARLEAQPSKP
ncbi:M48 family metallopeptidase [Geomesophilobacter sediminis]|uniref:M48 family metallopeptidase n=1 Tax=Geomesophilobacter sediminis TaxID=2798584 RepID=A0A8J7M0Z8_9BACT|nr:M48 family metallopeptidase [Geomesophilobacter sediminis]MBJ6726613.1 M48 family metallopeptidase [Geomesophilobacter sediminis]